MKTNCIPNHGSSDYGRHNSDHSTYSPPELHNRAKYKKKIQDKHHVLESKRVLNHHSTSLLGYRTPHVNFKSIRFREKHKNKHKFFNKNNKWMCNYISLSINNFFEINGVLFSKGY